MRYNYVCPFSESLFSVAQMTRKPQGRTGKKATLDAVILRAPASNYK